MPPKEEPKTAREEGRGQARAAVQARKSSTPSSTTSWPSVTKDKPKTPSARAEQGRPPRPRKPRASAQANKRRMTASITDYIRSQLINKRCWADHRDMADAEPPAARRSASGSAATASSRRPTGTDRARPRAVQRSAAAGVHRSTRARALDMCNKIGWVGAGGIFPAAAAAIHRHRIRAQDRQPTNDL